jgi:hypothetical protein
VVRIALRPDVAFPNLNLILLILSLFWFRLSPPGCEERRWARFAIWVFYSSITVGVRWWVGWIRHCHGRI